MKIKLVNTADTFGVLIQTTKSLDKFVEMLRFSMGSGYLDVGTLPFNLEREWDWEDFRLSDSCAYDFKVAVSIFRDISIYDQNCNIVFSGNIHHYNAKPKVNFQKGDIVEFTYQGGTKAGSLRTVKVAETHTEIFSGYDLNELTSDNFFRNYRFDKVLGEIKVLKKGN